MIESKTHLIHTVNGRVYDWSVSPESPLQDMVEVLTYYKGLIVDKLEEAQKQQVQHEKDNAPSVDESSESSS